MLFRLHIIKFKLYAGVCILLGLASCSQIPITPLPQPLRLPTRDDAATRAPGSDEASRQTAISPVVAPPEPTVVENAVPATGPALSNRPQDAQINLTFEQLPLPQFVQVVYGSVLKRAVNIDPQVASRTDLVTVRTGKPQTPAQVEQIARALLKSYGVAVIDQGNFVRVVPDANALGYSPLIKRGRALPNTPESLRPVFQLIELQAVSVPQVSNWLRLMFGTRVQITDDLARNAIMIAGQGDDVTAVMEAIRVLDQPLMKGRNALKITPVFWSADELARRIGELLSAQGYTVTNPILQGVTGPIQLVPIQAINTLFVFSTDPKLAEYVAQWAKELDRPSSRGVSSGYFTYSVKHTDADTLAKTIQNLIDSAPPTQTTANTGAAAGQQGAQPTAPRRSRVVVNAATNSLIFQGNSEEYSQWIGLLQELDKPAKSALIEVTVAEVLLDESEALGVQWYDLFRHGTALATLGGGSVLGNLPNLNASGLTISRLDSLGQIKAAINLLATSGRARVLSTPRVMARNGQTATIQVGREVPIVTSQLSNANTGGVGGVLQTIQYRSTGVILTVKPVIHSSGRVDIDLTQEVSTPGTAATGATSPPIDTRKVTTNLTLRDGSSVLIGGLMQQSLQRSNSGVPLLKDIPGVGVLFRNTTDTVNKTELIVLITPYVIEDDNDAEVISNAVRSQFEASDSWKRGPTAERITPGDATSRDALPVDNLRAKPMPVPAPVQSAPRQ